MRRQPTALVVFRSVNVRRPPNSYAPLDGDRVTFGPRCSEISPFPSVRSLISFLYNSRPFLCRTFTKFVCSLPSYTCVVVEFRRRSSYRNDDVNYEKTNGRVSKYRCPKSKSPRDAYSRRFADTT